MRNGYAVILHVATALATILAVPANAQTSDYPNRAIQIMVPFAAGGGTDVATRVIAEVMKREMKVPIVIENRPGANGIIAAQSAARAAPDGYSLFMTSLTTQSINPFLYKRLPYDPKADFVPIGLATKTAPVLLAGSSTQVKTIADVVALAKAKPGTLNFASSQTSSLYSTEMLRHQAGLDIQIVKYVSTPQAHADVAAGHIDFVFGDFVAAGGLIQAGKLRPIAVAAPQRLPLFPDVPTVNESATKGVELEIWSGLFAPAGISREIVDKLNKVLNLALEDKSVTEVFSKGAQVPSPSSPEEFRQYLDKQYEHWRSMTQALQVQPIEN